MLLAIFAPFAAIHTSSSSPLQNILTCPHQHFLLLLCFFAFFCTSVSKIPIMSSNVDPLVVGRVIGDVVDMFVPSVNMAVYYDSKHVTNGCNIKPSVAVAAPRVTITGDADELYTLVMTDPDAPSPSEPSMREWVHWILTDIPGCTNASRGKEVLAYMGPRPPVGIHRYIIVLFKQQKPLGFLEPPMSRANFKTRDFAKTFDLGEPVATVYYNAHREPTSRRRN